MDRKEGTEEKQLSKQARKEREKEEKRKKEGSEMYLASSSRFFRDCGKAAMWRTCNK